MIRQSLAADSAYVDLALHGDGLTSLQFRDSKGAATHEIQANITAPGRLRIEKRGKYTLMFLAAAGEQFAYSGAAANRPRRAVLCGDRRLFPRQGCHGRSRILEP